MPSGNVNSGRSRHTDNLKVCPLKVKASLTFMWCTPFSQIDSGDLVLVAYYHYQYSG
jgi:hypothetical protein